MATKTVPSGPDLMQKLDDAAKALAIAAPSIAAGDGKAFEAWVLMEIAAGLKGKVRVLAKDHKGAVTTTFRVSGGPGYIRSASSRDPKAPCHFELSGRSHIFELHSGVRHLGVGGHDHELDISVVAKFQADAIRTTSTGGPFNGLRLLAIELKDYDDYLPKVFARAMLGVAVDLSPAVVLGQVTVGPASARTTYYGPHIPRFRLMTSAPVRAGHQAFLLSYGIKTHPLLWPASSTTSQPAAIAEIVNDLIADLY